ncbi:MAG: glycolate oxidase iron-sulfur subunit [Acidimicrobiaceae bacterium]|nr:glycolate oxidase iron-sulfur subunit [Acidimicrobiaceae bacterium]
MTFRLELDDDELSSCVSCGLCLPHCPTYRTTGDESASPRGRIAAMRAVQWAGAPADDSFTAFMERCVQCRACETACPSSVPFGRLMEGARAALLHPWWKRLAYRVVGSHRLLVLLSTVAALLQRAGVRLPGLPRLPLRQAPLHASGTDVYLFTGCVMDAWSRSTHAAVQRVLEAAGAGVALPGRGADCCGALSVHAGLSDHARQLAARTMRAFPGDAPILVDAAGCGAALKDYGHLLGTAEAEAFSARVLDVSEWLAARMDRLPAVEPSARFGPSVAVQDPCHLRHVQRAHEHVRTVLRPFADVIELDDEGMCCGAGGAYSVQQPELSTAIRDRKLSAVARSGAKVVASANPGCAFHLAGAGLDVRHPLEIVDEVLRGR